jgi:hypothetical protein
MARYFLHLKDSVDEVLDPDGTEMPAEAVPGAALRSARDCIAGDVKEGRIDLHFRIEVLSETGELVHTLRFSDAVEVVSPR